MDEGTGLTEMLSLQLSEVEMLACMFPNQGEFVLDDPGSVAEIQSVVDGAIPVSDVNTRIGFTVRIHLLNDKVLELICHFPHEYPTVVPEVFLRASTLSRDKQRQLSEELQKFIHQLDRGEIVVGSVIDWLKENSEAYFDQSEEQAKAKPKLNPKGTLGIDYDTKFGRMWIYSHHIYSKIKRKDLLEITEELNLTGFTMPGKPGLIVVEGYNCHVEEFWSRIRRWQWKKITMKEKEEEHLKGQDVDKLRLFTNYEEKGFDSRPCKSKRGVHMNLGGLYSYLEEIGKASMFHLFFGVDGKSNLEDQDDD